MKILQKKSDCCNAKIIRFGRKRRQCVVCKRTWSEHQARRGPKPKRKQSNYLNNVFVHGFKVKHLAFHSVLSVDAVYKRFKNNLNDAVYQKRIIRIRGKKLILIIDAQWHYFRKDLWTLYFLSIKPTDSNTVTILDPVLIAGKENGTAWAQAINGLPAGIKKRIIALVTDGIRGIEGITEENDWIIQRCHFHLLKILQGMRGKRMTTSGRLIREEIFFSVKLALSETSEAKLDILCRRLAVLAQDSGCPTRMRGAVREFLRRLPDFRSYLDYPDLKIPTTTNVMESNNSLNRAKSRTVNSPLAWLKWATACARLKSKFICK